MLLSIVECGPLHGWAHLVALAGDADDSDDAAAAFQSQALLEYQFADGGSSWDIVDETVEV